MFIWHALMGCDFTFGILPRQGLRSQEICPSALQLPKGTFLGKTFPMNLKCIPYGHQVTSPQPLWCHWFVGAEYYQRLGVVTRIHETAILPDVLYQRRSGSSESQLNRMPLDSSWKDKCWHLASERLVMVVLWPSGQTGNWISRPSIAKSDAISWR